MVGTRLACPHCRVFLTARKTLPVGKRITCVKCKQPFEVAADMFADSQHVDHAETLILAETQAGTIRSPLAGVQLLPPREEASQPPPQKSAEPPMQPRRRPSKPGKRWLRAGLVVGMLLVLCGGGATLAYFLSIPPPAPETKPQSASVPVVAALVTAPQPKASITKAASVPTLKSGEARKRDVAAATARGVAFLKQKINPTGSWQEAIGLHAVGHAALPALALLECGVPASDPVVQKAAAYVRAQVRTVPETYDIGASILFLDHLGHPEDKKLIHHLALRLLAGQTAAGGWHYLCPLLADAESEQLLNFVHAHKPEVKFLVPLRRRPGLEVQEPVVATTRRAPPQLSRRMQDLPIVRRREQQKTFQTGAGPDDNSNTHFGLLGLWAARRHDLPVDLALGLTAERFQKTQAKDGGWGYVIASPPKNTMTCVGLLGLAMGHGAAAEIFADATAKGERTSKTLATDPAIQDGLKALGSYLEGHESLRGLEARLDLYYLWTLERVGLLYRQEKFGKKDWYDYGAKQILQRQQPDGRWQLHYDASIDTAFALLFLQRSDLVPDLTDDLHDYLAIPNATLRRRPTADQPRRRHSAAP